MSHVFYDAVANAAMGIPLIRRARVKRGRTTFANASCQAKKVIDEFEFFMDTIGYDAIRGKTVVEIGPGDSIPLAFLFLGSGASQYIAFDRFIGDALAENSLALYDAVSGQAPDRVKAGWTQFGIECSGVGLERLLAADRIALAPCSIEEATASNQADFIVSFNVLEHLSDVDRALRRMAILLKPTGTMIHRVDYGPHDVWKEYKNPLTFMVFPDWLWRVMGCNRGYPNRTRHSAVMATLAELNFLTSGRVTRLVPSEDVAEARRLGTRLRSISDEDLTTLLVEFASSRAAKPALGREFPY